MDPFSNLIIEEDLFWLIVCKKNYLLTIYFLSERAVL